MLIARLDENNFITCTYESTSDGICMNLDGYFYFKTHIYLLMRKDKIMIYGEGR
jgi:hypothetical protein